MALGFLRVDFRWDFDEADLNESAKALFHRLDQVFDILDAPGFAFLSTIELDAEADRFPDALAQYFGDDAWADTQSFLWRRSSGSTRRRSIPLDG